MNTSLLSQELAPLNAQVEQIQGTLEMLGGKLRSVEADLETFSADRRRFDALQDVCDAIDKLGDLKAEALFWEGIGKAGETAAHLEKVRGRISRFNEEISGFLEKQSSLQAEIDLKSDELAFVNEEILEVYGREERRREEFVIEREISPVPYRAMVMPWTKEAESESRFRRAVLTALLLCLLLGSVVPLVKVPVPDRTKEVVEIPKRLAMLVKKEPVIPEPVTQPKKVQEETEKPQEEAKKSQEEAKPEKSKPQQSKTKPDNKPKGGKQATAVAKAPVGGGGGGAASARKKAESVGVLAFSNTFKDLMKETPNAKLGTEARLSKQSSRVAGQAVARRSLVAMQAQGGSSGGISNSGVSMNIGNGSVDGGSAGIGMGGGGGDGDGTGFGFVHAESNIADLKESSRPLSDGVVAGRTDEEIQIVFDRYKAALYRIYNTELRKDPTLRGKILLRICIESNGAVSKCDVESTDLASKELVAKIVERIMRFNFGPKDGVPKMTILYPIDFLPAA